MSCHHELTASGRCNQQICHDRQQVWVQSQLWPLYRDQGRRLRMQKNREETEVTQRAVRQAGGGNLPVAALLQEQRDGAADHRKVSEVVRASLRTRFEVGSEDRTCPAGLGGAHDLVHRRSARTQGVVQRFERDVETELVAVAEAVHHGAGRGGDTKRHAKGRRRESNFQILDLCSTCPVSLFRPTAVLFSPEPLDGLQCLAHVVPGRGVVHDAQPESQGAMEKRR